MHVEGPLPRLPTTTPIEINATIWAMLMLKAFVGNLGGQGTVGRPWSWAMQFAEMAGAVVVILKGIGVEGQLGEVEVSGKVDNEFADEEWERFFAELAGRAGGGS